MKNASALFLFCTLVLVSSAQKNDSLLGAHVFKKNEISINSAPVFKVLFYTGNSKAERYSITYKRHLFNDRSALRFSVIMDKFNSHYERLSVSTSSVRHLEETQQTHGYWNPHINFGYEQIHGKKKVKLFYGTDFLIGYSESKSFRQYRVVSIGTDTLSSSPAMLESFNSDDNLYTKINTFSVGLNPFVGVKYPISKCFYISMQIGMEVVYKKEDISKTKAGVTYRYNTSSFDFDQDTGLINDISLVYTF